MSFTSAKPTNIPKYSYIAIAAPTIKTSMDSAEGYEFPSAMSKQTLDSGLGVDAAAIKHYSLDSSMGFDASRILLSRVETAAGSDYPSFTSRVAFDRGSGVDFTSLKTLKLSDMAVAREFSKMLLYVPKPAREALLEYLSLIDQVYSELGWKKEIRTFHYDIVADCVIGLLNFISIEMDKLRDVGVILGGDVYEQFEKCWLRAISYKRHRAGEIILPEDENQLIDLIRDVETLYSKLASYGFIKAEDEGMGREASSVMKVTEVYLFNTDDWSTARKYLLDYTLIFIPMGTGSLTSSEVEELVNTRRIVFLLGIDTEPYYPNPSPAFYPVFYRVLSPYSPHCDVNQVVDSAFQKFFGYNVPALVDYFTHIDSKVSGTMHWAVYTGDGRYGWGYKTYQKGAIIEIPFDGFWESADWLGKYVDAASSILLSTSMPTRILYLDRYFSGAYWWHKCHPIDACWQTLCTSRGWILRDLR